MVSEQLREIDRTIADISTRIDFYSLITPVNREEERKKFFSRLQEGGEYNPVFAYKKRDAADFVKPLQNARLVLNEEDPLQMLLAKKLDFIITQMELLEADDSGFGAIAARLHGLPDEACLAEAAGILSGSKDEGYVFPEETVTSDEMVAILRKELADKGIEWEVCLSGKIVPKITVSGKDRKIYVNSYIDYTAAEVERLKIHEVKVHVYRGANGSRQPLRLFADGLAGYDETEEGLAILAENITGCLQADTRQMKLYAGRALCADLCMKGSFFETFSRLSEFFPDYLAYRLAERGKRGLRDTSNKGGMTKGFHYISGWRKVRAYVEKGGDTKILYTGKIGLEDTGAVRSLLEKGVLSPPEYLPEFLPELGNK